MASFTRTLKAGLSGTGIEAAAGREAVIEAAGLPSDFVMVAIMGAAAIEPALAAIRRGVIVALANKECVVAAGAVFRDALEKSGASVIPVDSEHNAIFQVLGSGDASEVEMVTITASGGPFREWPLEKMREATVEEAVAHPNWVMGRKISLDSATLMNKGLELIEAHFLFALPPEKLNVLVHPQSIVHCLVSYDDGTTIAHLSAPDMRTPIAHALAWPRRIASPSRRLDLAKLGQLVFQAPSHDRFPALSLAIESLRSGGLAPTVLNAANEIAVQAFLDRRIGFLDIPRVVGETLERRCGAWFERPCLRSWNCAGRGRARRAGLPNRFVSGWGCKRIIMFTPCTVSFFGRRLVFPPFYSSSRWWCSSMNLGHFLVARACGVKVDVFSVGFGKEIFGSPTGTARAGS